MGDTNAQVSPVSVGAPTPRPVILGRYRLLSTIGRGGMAEVYLAVMIGPAQFSKLIALKMLRSQLADEPEARNMFLEEARLSARLNHANITQTYEAGEDEGQLYIAMEYLQGQPYSRILRRSKESPRPLPLHLGLRILSEVLVGLQYAHELKDFDGTRVQLVHRDISPQNIFVTYDGTIKIVDFGIAKAIGGHCTTNTGVLKGKIGFMAPEQVSGGRVDCRADIFPVGVLLWEMLSGRRLWQGMGDLEILQKLVNDPIPKVQSVAPSCDPELARIANKACARLREQRYQTAAEMQADLEAVLDGLKERATSREVGRWVAEHFADAREKAERAVEQQLAALKNDPSSFDPSPLSSNPSPPSLRSGPRPSTGTQATATLVSGSSDADYSTKRRVTPRGGALGKVAGIVAVGLAAAAFVFYRTRPRDPEGQGSAPHAAEDALQRPPAPTSSPTTAPAASVEVELAAEPKEARLFLDGRPLAANPTVSQLARDGAKHELRAEASGRETQTDTFVSDESKKVVLHLKEAKKTKTSAGAVRPATPSPKETAQPTTPPPPAPTNKTKESIDPNNPFN